MKILMPTIYHPYMGGITIHVENLIKNLNKIGDYEFHILNYKSEYNIPEDEFNKYYFDNVHIYEVPHISKIRGPSYFAKGYQLGKKIIKNEGIDIIHSHYAFPQGFLGAFLSKKFGIPHILTLHGSDVLRLSRNPVGKYFFNYAVKNCDNLVCVSNYLKNELIKSKCNICKTKKIDVVYNGVDTDLFYENGNDKNYGLFVGSFVNQKGIEILIESVKDLDFEFILIGDGELFKNFSDKINNEGIENIKLLGKKNQNETAKYIRNCSFLVLPSISEGLGMVLLEAMACGKPVVGTKVGGIPELIKDEYNGFLVPPNNPDELRKKIEILINNNELRKKVGRNGKEFSKNFSWENTAEKIDRIYSSVLKTIY